MSETALPPIQVYDSKTKSKKRFEPIHPGEVRLYWCGPTVYDHLHLGHARAATAPDIIRRYFEYRGYLVRYVANFTDVDDKIITRSIEESRAWRGLTVEHIDEYHRLMISLGNRPADVHPRATDHIPEMIAIVHRLIDRGNAYQADDGDVYFDTASFDAYGALSHRCLEDQQSSGRLDEERQAVKRNPGDFIVWKRHDNDPQEWQDAGPAHVPGWDSPWGYGRPGWHLECSALSERYLGVPFDIHGGGMDLLFPHHENELAQNDAGLADELQGGSSVATWMHNGFITINEQKMGKSLGNAFWLHELIWPDGPYDPMALRLMLIGSHYRGPVDFHDGLLDAEVSRLDKIYTALERYDAVAGEAAPSAEAPAVVAERRAEFHAAMSNDFNTAGALAAIAGIVNAAGETTDAADAAHAATVLRELLSVLGIRPSRGAGGGGGDEGIPAIAELALELRGAAREGKDWATADRIRDALLESGFAIEDRPDGTTGLTRK